jgi:hypothetical protein
MELRRVNVDPSVSQSRTGNCKENIVTRFSD